MSRSVFFIHRTKIKQCELDKGAARETDPDHVEDIKWERVEDPYGDFSPLLLTLLPEDNPDLDFSNITKLKDDILPSLLKQEAKELFGGSQEMIASTKLNFRVFGHQHKFEGSFEAYDILKDKAERQKALEYFQVYVYIGMSYEVRIFNHMHLTE